MSAMGVRKRLVQALIDGGGLLDRAAWESVRRYAEGGPLTPKERTALLDLDGAIGDGAVLAAAGLNRGALRLSTDALAAMQQFAEAQSLQVVLGQLQVEGSADAPAPAPAPTDEGPAAAARRRLTQALAAGRSLGPLRDWAVQTAGADVVFHTEAFGQVFPALVMTRPDFHDPDPRDLSADLADRLAGLKRLDQVKALAQDILSREAAWFSADALADGPRNRRAAIQQQRRQRLLDLLRDHALAQPGMGIGVNAVLTEIRDDALSGVDFEMEVGSHTNYWPYDNGYDGVVEKILGQVAPDGPGAVAIGNRLADILRRKTVFAHGRSVDERDAERSLGAILTWRRPHGPAHAPRISLAEGWTPDQPRYERLEVLGADGAQTPVYREGDGSLRFDWTAAQPGRSGQVLPPGAESTLRATPVPADEIGLRRPHSGESTRGRMPLDWNQDGQISIMPIDIGWWGHCHNEAPANAMGMDPKKAVSLYRADRGVASDAALVRYSAEDCWDAIGSFTADHEGARVRDPRTGQVSNPGYVNYSSGGAYDPTRVDETDFVGNRNNGGHYIQISPARAGGRRIRVEAEVTAIWGLQDPTIQYKEPMNRFRRDIENDDGSFAPNPDWVDSGMSDSDMIAVEAAGRRMRLRTRFISFDARGQRSEQHLDVNLDPSQDAFIKLAEELESVDAGGGGRLVEFYYNPATRQLKEQPVTLSAADGFARKLGSPRVDAVSQVIAVQETTYDSVAEIDEFVVADMGLPFTFDTSSGQAVWNYPVSYIRRDVEGRQLRDEEGQSYQYTTYRLRYRTMGGPDGDTRYTIKRDSLGRMVRALALRPMPDFAFRNERWVCAPATLDHRGRPAVNLRALTAGYLTGAEGRDIVSDLWRHQAALVYASISDQTPAAGAWLFETVDGDLLSFPDAARFDEAVAADRALRTVGA